MYNAALRPSAPCYAPRLSSSPRNSTQRFVYFFSRLNSQRLGSPRRGTPQLNDLFVTSHLRAPPLNATCLGAVRRTSPQRNDLFVTSRRSKAQRSATLHAFRQRSSPQFNSTICLLRRNDNTALLSDTHVIAPMRKTTLHNSTQRTET